MDNEFGFVPDTKEEDDFGFVPETTAPEQTKPEEETSQAMAGLRGIAEGGTLGFIDELTAGINTPIAQLSGDAPEGESWSDTYRAMRDIVRGQQATAEEQHPGTYTTGEFAGAIAPMMATGGASTIPQAMAKGAGFGSAYGAGKANELSDVPLDALEGAAWGAGGAGVLGAAGKGFAVGGEKLARLARKIKPKTPSKPPLAPGTEIPVKAHTRVVKEPKPTGVKGVMDMVNKASPSDLVAGGLGALTGGIPGAIAAVGTKKVVEKKIKQYGTVKGKEQLSAAIRKYGKKLDKWSKAFQQASTRGGNALVSTHYVLQQQDPEYRQAWNEIDEEEKNEE